MNTTTKLLSRKEAVAQAGIAAVEKLDNQNCEPTGRMMGDHSDLVEYSSSVKVGIEQDGGTFVFILTAYYYPTRDELEAAGDDLGNLNWSIEGYTLYY
jgi:hypothetical protein